MKKDSYCNFLVLLEQRKSDWLQSFKQPEKRGMFLKIQIYHFRLLSTKLWEVNENEKSHSPPRLQKAAVNSDSTFHLSFWCVFFWSPRKKYIYNLQKNCLRGKVSKYCSAEIKNCSVCGIWLWIDDALLKNTETSFL